MSALGSSSLRFDPSGFPFLQSIGANFNLTSDVNSGLIPLVKVPAADIYNMNLRGFINGGGNNLTRVSLTLYADNAGTELISKVTCIVPLGALQGDPYPININFTFALPASVGDNVMTAIIAVFGADTIIYNAMPNSAVAGQGLAFYWQSDTRPLENTRRIPDFIAEMP